MAPGSYDADGTTPSACLHRRDPLAGWRLAPDRLLVQRRGATRFELTGMVAMVWLALDVPRSAEELADELAGVAGAATDVGQALDELAACGLVEEVREEASAQR